MEETKSHLTKREKYWIKLYHEYPIVLPSTTTDPLDQLVYVALQKNKTRGILVKTANVIIIRDVLLVSEKDFEDDRCVVHIEDDWSVPLWATIDRLHEAGILRYKYLHVYDANNVAVYAVCVSKTSLADDQGALVDPVEKLGLLNCERSDPVSIRCWTFTVDQGVEEFWELFQKEGRDWISHELCYIVCQWDRSSETQNCHVQGLVQLRTNDIANVILFKSNDFAPVISKDPLADVEYLKTVTGKEAKVIEYGTLLTDAESSARN
jgi:hypothetical protein